MPDLWMDVDAALSEVPVNIIALIDDGDFKTREESVAYNASGMELIWHFITTAGATTATVVTPTTSGLHDWAHQDGGMYTIEIPTASGDINNTLEGFGWFTGVADGILPWRGPVIGLRAAGINNLLIDSASSATRGLAGTALPDAVADAAGGLPISDDGNLDLDTQLAETSEITAARMGALTDWIDAGRLDAILDAIKAKTDNLPGSIPKNAALSNFAFLMVDDDHWTPKTGVSITGTISKDGGAFAALTNAETEIGNGMYKVDITQTEMNADVIILRFTATGADDRIVTLYTDS